MIDEEHTSLATAVAALGDDAGRQPTVEEIAEKRRADTREKAIFKIADLLSDGGYSHCLLKAADLVDDLYEDGLVIVQRRPK